MRLRFVCGSSPYVPFEAVGLSTFLSRGGRKGLFISSEPGQDIGRLERCRVSCGHDQSKVMIDALVFVPTREHVMQ